MEVRYAVGEWPRSVTLADLNGNGIPDVVTANGWDDTISVLLGRLADANGSNDVGPYDLAAFNPRSGAVRVSASEGDRFDTSRWDVWSTEAEWVDVLVGDFSGNNLDDIAMRNADTGAVRVAVNNGDGTFTTTPNMASCSRRSPRAPAGCPTAMKR